MPVLIDGADLASTVFLATGATFTDDTWSGDLDPGVDAPPSRAASGQFGEVLTGAPASPPPRTLRVEGWLQAPTAPALAAGRDALVQACLGGRTTSGPTAALVAVTLAPDPTVGGGTGRVHFGFLSAESRIAIAGAVGRSTLAKVTLVFRCPDPRAYDPTVTTVPLAINPLKTRLDPAKLGTVPTPPLFTLPGPWTSVVLWWEDSFDNVLANLCVAGTLPVGETIQIDCGQQTITRIVGSTRTPANTWYQFGEFFQIDPGAQNGTLTPAIFVTLDNGTGAGFSVQYRPAYR